MVALWMLWERLFHVVMRLQPLVPGESHLFFFSVRRYFGRPFVAGDVTVKRFDRVIEIHMNNQLIMQLMRETDSLMALVVRLIQLAKRDLPLLAQRLASPEFDGIGVLIGTTFIHRSVQHFGFQTRDISSRLWRGLVQRHLRFVFRMVNPHADEFLRSHAEVFVPKLVYISRARLLQRFRVIPSTPTVTTSDQ